MASKVSDKRTGLIKIGYGKMVQHMLWYIQHLSVSCSKTTAVNTCIVSAENGIKLIKIALRFPSHKYLRSLLQGLVFQLLWPGTPVWSGKNDALTHWFVSLLSGSPVAAHFNPVVSKREPSAHKNVSSLVWKRNPIHTSLATVLLLIKWVLLLWETIEVIETFSLRLIS